MRFFEDCRVSFYFHGGRLIKDGKTGRQYWRLDLVITLVAAEVLSCDDAIRNCYEHIETREHLIEELKLSGEVRNQVIEFFALVDHQAAVLHLGATDLTDLRMTRVEDMTELWVRAQAENTDKLHQFVKDYAFTRLWVTFKPVQMPLLPTPAPKQIDLKSAKTSEGVQ